MFCNTPGDAVMRFIFCRAGAICLPRRACSRPCVRSTHPTTTSREQFPPHLAAPASSRRYGGGFCHPLKQTWFCDTGPWFDSVPKGMYDLFGVFFLGDWCLEVSRNLRVQFRREQATLAFSIAHAMFRTTCISCISRIERAALHHLY
jgi:hypothetical protein